MAKTYKNRKNVWDDGARTSKPKSSLKQSRKKKYQTHEIVDFKDIDYEYLQ